MGALRPKLGHTLADTKIQSVKDVCALFGRKERNSARRANTARLRAITKERYGKDGYGYTQFFLTIAARPLRGRTSSVACRRHLPLKGKASLRIKISGQHNNTEKSSFADIARIM